MKKQLLFIGLFFTAILTINAQLIKNDFTDGLNVGDALEKGAYPSATQGETNPIMTNQWDLTGKTGAGYQDGSSPLVVAPLTYTDYVESGTSNAFELARFVVASTGRLSVYSLANDNTYQGKAYYLAMMVKVDEVGSTNGADFLMLDGNYTGNNQRAKVFVKNGSSSGNFVFGISDDASAPAQSSGDYAKGETFLLVLKYDFTTPTGGIKLFVNPDPKATEPVSATLTTNINSALTSIRGITIRQRTTLKASLGGLRFAESWEDALGLVPASINNQLMDKGQIVSSKYCTLSGVQLKEALQHGVYIQTNVYENGYVETLKIIR